MSIVIQNTSQLEGLQSLSDLKVTDKGQLAPRSALGRAAHAVADAFRSLSESGRASIQRNSDAIIQKMSELVVQEAQQEHTELSSIKDTFSKLYLDSLRAEVRMRPEFKELSPKMQAVCLSGMKECSAMMHSREDAFPRDTWRGNLNKVLHFVSGTSPEGFSIDAVKEKFETDIKPLFASEQTQKSVVDGIHSKFFADALRGELKSVDGQSINIAALREAMENSGMKPEEITESLQGWLRDVVENVTKSNPKALPFVSMMLGQQGMTSMPSLVLSSQFFHPNGLTEMGLPTDWKSHHRHMEVRTVGNALELQFKASQEFFCTDFKSEYGNILRQETDVSLRISLDPEEMEELPHPIEAEEKIFIPKFTVEKLEARFTPLI